MFYSCVVEYKTDSGMTTRVQYSTKKYFKKDFWIDLVSNAGSVFFLFIIKDDFDNLANNKSKNIVKEMNKL